MALFLEVFRILDFDRTADCLDHVSVPAQMIATGSFLFYWGPFLLYSALILICSSIPRVPGTQYFPDKLLHFVEYSIYTFLLWWGLTRRGLSRLTLQRIGLVLLAGSLYGAVDELYQSFVPGRSSSIRDWYADVAGTVAMITIILVKDKYGKHTGRVI